MPSRTRRSSSPSPPSTVVDAEPGLDDVVAAAAVDVVVAVAAVDLVVAGAAAITSSPSSPATRRAAAVVELVRAGAAEHVVGMSTWTIAVSSRSPRSIAQRASRRAAGQKAWMTQAFGVVGDVARARTCPGPVPPSTVGSRNSMFAPGALDR